MNSSYGGERMNINIVNNYYKPGPATVTGSKRGRIFAIDATENRNGGYLWGKYYIDGNVVDGGQMNKNSQKAYDWCVGFLNEHPEFMDTFSQFSEDYLDSFSVWMKNDLIGYFQRIVTEVSSGVIGVAGFFKNLLIGCVAAVYLLSGRRKFCAQARRLYLPF